MHRLTDWIEPLLLKALNQHLSSKNAASPRQTLEQPFSIEKELSNLRICLSASQNLFLVEVHGSHVSPWYSTDSRAMQSRSSAGNVEATLADSTSKIETVFPRETVRLWQAQARNRLTSLPSGTLFQVLESELRISDCFIPPRIELWIYSFNVVGGIANNRQPVIGEIGTHPSLRGLLDSYAESEEIARSPNQKVESMGSSLRAQERADKDRVDAISQPFYTQLSEHSASDHNLPGSTAEEMRVSHLNTKLPNLDTQETPSVQPAQEGVQDTVKSAEPTSIQAIAHVLGNKPTPGSASPKQTSANSASEPPSHADRPDVVGDRWPGGRTPLMKGKYLPRHLTKIPKDQQKILESFHAWQPSTTDRRIRGSVPNQILDHFTAVTDKTDEIAASQDSLNVVTTTITKELAEEVQPDQDAHDDHLEEALDSSSSAESEHISWASTSVSAPPKSAFPDNSSPIQAPGRRTSLLSQNETPAPSTEIESQQKRNTESESLVLTPNIKTGLLSVETLDKPQTAPSTQHSVEPLNIILDAASSPKLTGNMSRKSSPRSHLSQYQNERKYQDEESSESCPSQSEANHNHPRPHSGDAALQIETHLTQRKADRKALIQVQRTPFVHQPGKLIKAPVSRDRDSAFPYSSADECPPNGQEAKSSPLVVPGTYTNAQAEECRQSGRSTNLPLDKEPDSSKLEQMAETRENDADHISDCGTAEKATHDAYASSTYQESQSHSCPQRPHKRKNFREDDGQPKIQSQHTVYVDEPRLDAVPSKKQRLTSKFPSLDTLRDLNTAKRPSEIARESRRQFFHNQQRAASNGSPRPGLTPVSEMSFRAREAEIVHQREVIHTTPRISLLYDTSSKPASESETISRSCTRRQNIYDAYRAAYPEYQGDALQFHKTCLQIKVLQGDGKAPHPSLWDDFIFRRYHDYRDYLVEVAEACEDALPYLQYYTDHVEKPLRVLLVVRPSYVSSLGADSGIGSSITSPALAAPHEIPGAPRMEESIAASSSASNIVPPQPATSPAVSGIKCRQPSLERDLDSRQLNETEHIQESSVEQWVELQSRAKTSGAESPELGYGNVFVEEEDIPVQDMDKSTDASLASPSPDRHQALPEQKRKEAVWSNDANTPFKTFSESYVNLASEKRRLKRPVRVDRKGCLKPHLQNVIEIFTRYRR